MLSVDRLFPLPSMSAPSDSLTPAARYARLVATLTREPTVAVGAGKKKGFGASALSTNGKIFALLSSRDRFVIKLPATRVAELVDAGIGAHFDPGHGRLMKQWLEVASGQETRWTALAREAQMFVAEST